jgi:hypothetical protein
LDAHVEERAGQYLTKRLYRIHVTPMEKDTTMAAYTFKAFKNGRIKPDDILVLK